MREKEDDPESLAGLDLGRDLVQDELHQPILNAAAGQRRADVLVLDVDVVLGLGNDCDGRERLKRASGQTDCRQRTTTAIPRKGGRCLSIGEVDMPFM